MSEIGLGLYPVNPYHEEALLRHLLNLFQYDFTSFIDMGLPSSGVFPTHDLDGYFTLNHTTSPDHYAYIARSAANWIVGYMLADVDRRILGVPLLYIRNFWVMPNERRKGAGRAMIEGFMTLHPGPYHLYVMRENTRADRFWKSVLSGYPGYRRTRYTGTPEGSERAWNGWLYRWDRLSG